MRSVLLTLAALLAAAGCNDQPIEEHSVCYTSLEDCEGDVGSCRACCPNDLDFQGTDPTDGCWYECDDGWYRIIEGGWQNEADATVRHCMPSVAEYL